MENRFKCAVLTLALAMSAAASIVTLPAAADRGRVLEDVVSPDLERRRIKESKIDSENIEIGFFAGIISIEDFGSNNVYGGRIALHITEDLFIEGHVGVSELQETSYETLSGETRLLTDDQRELLYYNLSVGWNVFPGEIYIRRWAFKSNLYLVGGAGNTEFADNEYFTYHFGGGWRLFLTDWLAMRLDVRNHVMSHNIFGEEKNIQNLETHLGFTVFF